MAPNGVYSVRRLEKSVSFEERLACFLASAQIPPAFSRAGRTDSIDCATPTHLAELNHLEASRRARSPSHLLLELRARHILGLEVGLRSPHPFHAASAPHSVSSSLIAKCSSTAFFSSSSMSCSSSLVFHSFSSSLAQLHFRADVLGQVVALRLAPFLTEYFHRIQHEFPLLLRELAVLPGRVQVTAYCSS